MDDTMLRERAEQRVAARASFYSHLATYLVVNAGLFFIDYMTGGGIDWAFWPAAGWGIGLLSHAASTIFTLGGDRERAIEREMDKLRRRT